MLVLRRPPGSDPVLRVSGAGRPCYPSVDPALAGAVRALTARRLIALSLDGLFRRLVDGAAEIHRTTGSVVLAAEVHPDALGGPEIRARGAHGVLRAALSRYGIPLLVRVSLPRGAAILRAIRPHEPPAGPARRRRVH